MKEPNIYELKRIIEHNKHLIEQEEKEEKEKREKREREEIEREEPINQVGQKFSEGKLPIYKVLFEQFPNAIQEVVKCSQAGHIKYPNDTDWQNFRRVENPNHYLDAALRHLLEYSLEKAKGNISIDEELLNITGVKVLSLAQVIWNFTAYLERELNENSNNK